MALNQYKTQWTEEKTNELMRLLDAREPTSKMMQVLGTTKNAIVGKIHRLGRRTNGEPYHAPVRQHRPRLVIYRTYAAFAPEYEMQDQATKPEKLATSDPCDLLGLTTQTCHWPLWSGPDTEDKRYCGAPTGGKVYCEQHTLTATAIRRKDVTPKPFSLP